MPTGYTAYIKDGISVKEFILKCARAFGACVSQRDEPMDTLPKKEEFSDYYPKKIIEAEDKLESVESMTIEQCKKKAEQEYKLSISQAEKALKEKELLAKKYNEMKDAIIKWKPPTKDHENLKAFMIEQIESSIQFDCGETYYKDMLKQIKQLTGNQWKKEKIKSLKDDIAYYTKSYNEEVKRITDRNNWIEKLYGSLPNE